MRIREFMEIYEKFCPKEASLPGDSVGLQIGDLDKEIHKVMVTLDIREATVQEAIREGVDLILAKHTILFRPLSQLTAENPQEKMLLDLIQYGISVYTSHSNVDIIPGGLNDLFCDRLEIKEVVPLTEKGLGRVGNVTPQPLRHLVKKTMSLFKLDHTRIITYDRSLDQMISRVAICGGSGGGFWPAAREKGADVYITSDIYYHDGHDMLSNGLFGIDPGHYMEHLFVPMVANKLRSFRTGIPVIESQSLTNPFFDI